MTKIDDFDRFWSFLTVRFNLVWGVVMAAGAAFWVGTNQPTRDWLMSFLPNPDVVVGLVMGLSAAASAVTIYLRARKQPVPGDDSQAGAK